MEGSNTPFEELSLQGGVIDYSNPKNLSLVKKTSFSISSSPLPARRVYLV